VLTVVVLAAGESKRFGSQKLLHKLEGSDTLLERAIRASGAFDSVVVCSEQTLPAARALHAHTIVNREPERGMIHSLRLANRKIDPERPILVLTADLLLIEPHHVADIAAAVEDADVVHPVRSDGTPGHPVYFSARARALIAKLRDNEPIAKLRDDPSLTRRTVTIDEAWPYRDVDTRSDLPV
jgi:molybdenum cofactor cytidylyltransferase